MAVVWKKLAFEDDVVLEALFNADTFLYATEDNTPVATSPANVMAALSGHAAAEFLMNTQKIGGVVDPTTNQQVATKKYVDDQIAVDTFLELTDTPAAYAGEGGKLVVVNATPDALEFVAITTFLEGAPTEDLATKAPTSEWAFDHNAKKAANAILGHVMVEDTSLIDVDGDGKLTLGAHAATHKLSQSDEIDLDELGVPTGAVDFDLQEATDLVVFTVADEATRDALAAGATEVGQLCWATSEGSLAICTESS